MYVYPQLGHSFVTWGLGRQSGDHPAERTLRHRPAPDPRERSHEPGGG